MQEIGKAVEKVKEVYHDKQKESEQAAAAKEKSKTFEHLGKALKPGESITEQLGQAKEHYNIASEHTSKATEHQEKSGAAAKKAEEGHA